jgi:hypothetical protein
VVAIVVVLVACAIGSATAFVTLRRQPAPAATSALAPAFPQPTVPQSPPSVKSPAGCLIGDWVETSYAGNADIYGTRVQLTGEGTLTRYAADGTVTMVLENVSVTGSAGGDNFEVIHNGVLRMNYIADDTTIHYSNPQSEGTTTWKVNGKERDSAQLKASLKPDTYKCDGNRLR